MSRPTVRIFHHMARTGGTLICKCLGSMQGVILLSEIHPAFVHMFNPLAQATRWFNLFSEQQAQEFAESTPSFSQVIATINERCDASDLKLVIRDWSHIDFTGTPFVQKPSYRFALCDALQANFEIINICSVRHPIDQYLSLNALNIMQGHLNIDNYIHGYWQFARKCLETGFIRYEDFTHQPDSTLQTLCTRLRLEFDPGYTQRWRQYQTITGDTVNTSNRIEEIRPSTPRAVDPRLLDHCAANPYYHEALQMLGYIHPSQ
ncbi:MAG: hypothetical protein HY940_04030 [Gammaproteobacteria bacterium]|nr:hypothetical protein [Gammaproteobacteria bacterium]